MLPAQDRLSLVKTPRSRGTFRISNLPNRNIPSLPKWLADVTMLHAGSIPCGWSFGEGQGELEPASTRNPYLCSIRRNVRLIRGWSTSGSFGNSCLKFFWVFPAIINKLPWDNRSAKATVPSGPLRRNRRSAPRLIEAITGPISGSASACRPTLSFPFR